MAIVSFNGVRREYAGRWVLDGVTFELSAGQKTGLIGANGTGKTTLLRILCGLESAQEGSVQISSFVRIGYVPQYVEFHTDQTVWDYLVAGHHSLRERLDDVERQMEETQGEEMARLLQEYEAVRDAYDQSGGDHFESRARAMLDALGLAEKQDQIVERLSGGEQNVLSLTQALLDQPNLLILDEPGNHLDYMGLAWLEDFLRRFRGAILIVSHNRYLLDRVVDHMMELEQGKLTEYPGNYSAYREFRIQQRKSRQHQYEAHQNRITQLESLVQKFADIAQGHASDNTWGRRLRARRSQLEKVRSQGPEKPPAEASRVAMRFDSQATRADIALQIQGYRKAFGEKVLFKNLIWQITGGQRWALAGPNGCGKTTLLKDIIQEGDWENPVIRIGPSLMVGYCAQQQEVLDDQSSVYDQLSSVPGATHQQVLGILARFLFRDEEVHKKIGSLSGGERNRLQLATLMLQKPNFLILDEPTNHLDIPTREAVEQALKEFEGTLLVVSHDRYFLDEVVDHIAEVHDRDLRFYSGNFTQYWDIHQQTLASVSGRITQRGKARQQNPDEKNTENEQQWKQRKAQAASQRKAQKTLQELEEAISRLEGDKKNLEIQISQAYMDQQNELGMHLSEELRILQGELERVYARWLEANEERCETDGA